MLSADFDFPLPEYLVALRPSDKRDMSRLFVLHKNGETEHRLFSDLPDYMNAGDLLLLNNTKVMPVRISATSSSGRTIEVLFVKETNRSGVWEVLCKTSVKGRIVLAGSVEAEIWTEKVSDGSGQRIKLVRLSDSSLDLMEVLNQHGAMPLPPYIKRNPDHKDRDRYQTVYAKHQGSIAAPTAGLHFTDELLDRIKAKGVKISTLTLHVGQGTFRPLRAARVEDHKMDSEMFKIPYSAVEEIRRAKEACKRVFSVGTTTTRALEAYMSDNYNPISPEDADTDTAEQSVAGSTSIFIYPGYSFRAVDCLITNFHLPVSTPLMLASAFCGYEKLMKSYKEAMEKGYGFFSYGDAMLIV